MGKFKEKLKKDLPAYLIAFFVGLVVGIIIWLLVYFLGPNKKAILGAIDGASIAFISLLGLGGLGFVARAGMFDSLSYGFNQLRFSMFSKEPNKYHDFNEYREGKISHRSASPSLYIALLFAAIPYGIAIIVLEIILHI